MTTSIAVRHTPHASPPLAQRRAVSRPTRVVALFSRRELAIRCRHQSQQSVSLRRPGPASRRSVRAAAAAAEGKDGEAQLSAEEAEEAQDLRDIQDIVETIELLKERRDMTVQEIRLVLMIEDPREAERRRQMGIENESGCSRDEIADAFRERSGGGGVWEEGGERCVPADRMVLRKLALRHRMVLRKLAQDMRDWPRLRFPPTCLPHASPLTLSPTPPPQPSPLRLSLSPLPSPTPHSITFSSPHPSSRHCARRSQAWRRRQRDPEGSASRGTRRSRTWGCRAAPTVEHRPALPSCAGSQAHDSHSCVSPGMRWFFRNCAVSRVSTIFHCAFPPAA
ncbi:unnamed protein product [Closterium sp. NIES-65]|nr:unnamed protein product [Closterium sp. NIES-65]